MAYDQTGAAIGGAGHDAAAITAALITSGVISGVSEAMETYDRLLVAVFNSENAVKEGAGAVEAISAPRASTGSAPRRSSGGGNSGGPAGDLAFNSGKKRGQTIASVYADDPSYIEWCAAELKNEFMRDKCIAYLAEVA